MSLQFFISHKGPIAVISFTGAIDTEAAETILPQCSEQVLAENRKGIILHFGEVSALPFEAFRAFTLFLRGIKSKGAYIKVSMAPAKIREELIQAGIFDFSEFEANLPEAIQDIAGKLKTGTR